MFKHSIILILAMTVFISTGLAKDTDTDVSSQSKSIIDTLPSAGVFMIASITLKDSTKAKEFEDWAINKYHPLTENHFPGMRIFMTKGDRGQGKGDYMLFGFFDSEERRTYYYPVEGKGLSEEGLKIWNETGADEVMNTFYELASFKWLGDYRIVE